MNYKFDNLISDAKVVFDKVAEKQMKLLNIQRHKLNVFSLKTK